jgi:carbamoyltransferase
LAGGCALNATLNGKIGRSGLIERLFVQPDAGDGGGALGAAYLAHLKVGCSVPRQELAHAYWGPSFNNDEIEEQLAITKTPYEKVPDEQIPDCVSKFLVEQNIVGWFQLGSEWGPRALGARSILADPRIPGLRDRINEAVKYRDWWRPFAPSMLAEAADAYLESSFFAPFMASTFHVRAAKASDIAGVTHVDGTTRPQTLVRDINPRYFDVIRSFGRRTGVPVVLNTSFNLKGEPIVNTPRDALRTFFGSGLDVLIMNNVVVRKALL